MDLTESQTLSTDLGVLLLHLFFPLPPSKQILLEAAIEEPFVSLAILKIVAFIAIVP